jgi:hypothetical protein
LYKAMLFGNDKEWSTDTCYNLDEPWKHNAKQKEPKGNVFYDSIFMKCPG